MNVMKDDVMMPKTVEVVNSATFHRECYEMHNG